MVNWLFDKNKSSPPYMSLMIFSIGTFISTRQKPLALTVSHSDREKDLFYGVYKAEFTGIRSCH